MTTRRLPKIDSAKAQADESARALAHVFKSPEFLLRSKPESDYGVDFEVELGIDGQATNFKTELQLKSIASPNFVENGSFISYPMKVASLNYLMNSSFRTLIVLYDASQRALFFQWTDLLVAQLDREPKRDWQDQATASISVPTSNRLDESTAPDIHAKILEYCKRRAQSSHFTGLGIGETPDSSQPTVSHSDQDEILRQLDELGLALATGGRPGLVLSMASSLPRSAWMDHPRVVAAVAAAHDRGGIPLQALHLSTIVARLAEEQEVSDEVRALAASIAATARFNLGHTAPDAYEEQLAQICREYPETTPALERSFELLERHAIRANSDQRILELVRQADTAADKARGDSPPGGVDVLLARIEFAAANNLLVRGLATIEFRRRIGSPTSVLEGIAPAARAAQLGVCANDRLHRVHKQAYADRNAPLVGLALYSNAYGNLNQFVASQAFSPQARAARHDAEGEAQLERIRDLSSDARKIFEKIGHGPLAFEAARIEVEALELLNSPETAAARRALSEAGARLGVDPRFAAPRFSEARQALAAARAERRRELANASNEQLEAEARAYLAKARFPVERFRHVVADLHSSRAEALEQLEWCIHLQVLCDNEDHLTGASYTREIERVAYCDRLGHRSLVPATTAGDVVCAFKRNYCVECRHRSLS